MVDTPESVHRSEETCNHLSNHLPFFTYPNLLCFVDFVNRITNRASFVSRLKLIIVVVVLESKR